MTHEFQHALVTKARQLIYGPNSAKRQVLEHHLNPKFIEKISTY